MIQQSAQQGLVSDCQCIECGQPFQGQGDCPRCAWEDYANHSAQAYEDWCNAMMWGAA